MSNKVRKNGKQCTIILKKWLQQHSPRQAKLATLASTNGVCKIIKLKLIDNASKVLNKIKSNTKTNQNKAKQNNKRKNPEDRLRRNEGKTIP